jgi:hypothetical protein
MKLAKICLEIESLFGPDVHLMSAPAKSVWVFEDTIRIDGVKKYISFDVSLQLANMLSLPRRYVEKIANKNTELFLAILRDALSRSRRNLSFFFSGPDVVAVLPGEDRTVRRIFETTISALSNWYGAQGTIIHLEMVPRFSMITATSTEADPFPALRIDITQGCSVRVSPHAGFTSGGYLVDFSSSGWSSRRHLPSDYEFEEIFQLAYFYADELVCTYNERKGDLIDNPVRTLRAAGGDTDYILAVTANLRGERIDILGPLIRAAAKTARTFKELEIPFAMLRGDEENACG